MNLRLYKDKHEFSAWRVIKLLLLNENKKEGFPSKHGECKIRVNVAFALRIISLYTIKCDIVAKYIFQILVTFVYKHIISFLLLYYLIDSFPYFIINKQETEK